MKRYIAYLKYVLNHKWHVFWACMKMGVPVHRAIIHDWTKFTKPEWTPYAIQFFNSDGTKRNVRNSDGSYDPNAQSKSFKRAWLNHQKNKHHWQSHISIGDNGSLDPLSIPETYIREMIADWIGAGMSIAKQPNPTDWYNTNKSKMIIHPESIQRIEMLMKDRF